jgi:5-methylcytosine-specific restriction endonuclease McrA
MQRIRPKQPRIQLDPLAYDDLRLYVLQRDAWRCQICGSGQNLEVHHKNFRSQLGDDSEENLITLCTICHRIIHRQNQRYRQGMAG